MTVRGRRESQEGATDQGELFDATPYERDPEPHAPDPLAGLGRDARATLRYRRFMKRGVHPGTHLPLHSAAAPVGDRHADGLRCGGCAHLYVKLAGASRFLKCERTSLRADVATDGPDMRAWWPACTVFARAGESS